MWLRDSGMHRGLFRIFSGPSPYMGSGLAPRLGPRPQSLHHARCFPSPRASIQEVVAMTREDTGGPLLLIYTTMSICPISSLLHVHSGLEYLAMPLSCLPCWTPGPRVSTRHTPIWAVVHNCCSRQKGTRDQWTQQSPRIWTGGCDKHPHSWPPAHGFPTFSCWAPLLSPAEGPVLCHPNHTGLCGWQGRPGHTALGRARSPKSRASAAQRKRTWDCTGV